MTRRISAGMLAILLFIPARIVTAQAGSITTVAGTGSAGFSGDNGPATSARLNTPRGVAVDADGHLYIADSANHRIRRVHRVTGTITTVAGTGVSGYNGDGISATAARLFSPRDIGFDEDGNLYIADSQNNRVRRVDADTGLISTVAGTGVFGAGADGILAVDADLRQPGGLDFDAAGHLYFTEVFGHRVRRVDANTGLISTVAGTGTAGFNGNGIAATSAQLHTPTGVILDEDGRLLIADSGNNRIRRVNRSTGVIGTIAGTGTFGFGGDGGDPAAAKLATPTAVRQDESGHLFIADFNNHRVRRVDAETGLISTIAGTGTAGATGDGGPAVSAQLNSPYGLVLDEDGNLFIGEAESDRVRRLEGLAAAPNSIPDAEASFTLAVPMCSEDGNTLVSLDASASTDEDLDPLTYTWTGPFAEGNGTVTGVTPTVTLPLGGPHTVVLTVDDGEGGEDTDDVQITIEDASSPTLVIQNPAIVVPPNTGTMRYVDVIAESGALAVDACDVAPTIAVDGPTLFRRGTTTDVTLVATDASGNSISAVVSVTVEQGGRPEDPGKPDYTGPPPVKKNK